MKVSDGPWPRPRWGVERRWTGLSARRVLVDRGLHRSPASAEHRLIFYTDGPTRSACVCAGLSQRRTQVPGDFDLIPAGCEASWDDETATSLISIRLTEALIDRMREDLDLDERQAPLTPRLGDRDPLVEEIVWALAAELDAPASRASLLGESLAVALAARLLQRCAVAPARAGHTLSRERQRRLVEYVEANLKAPLTLATLARVAEMSVPHLSTLFRRSMGRSVHRYVVERRVQRAQHLLQSGRLSIAEVAAETGFAQQSHLARWTKRLLGVSPSDILRDRSRCAP